MEPEIRYESPYEKSLNLRMVHLLTACELATKEEHWPKIRKMILTFFNDLKREYRDAT